MYNNLSRIKKITPGPKINFESKFLASKVLLWDTLVFLSSYRTQSLSAQ